MSIIPANPKIVGSRPYTGNSDGAAAGPISGMDEVIRQSIKYANGALWNNGSWGVRDMRGKPGSLSVHATGRAWDASNRMTEKHQQANRKSALIFIKAMVANANALGVEMIIDYAVKDFGRAWRCDRQAWQKYDKQTVEHGGSGDWFHIEHSPAFVNQPLTLIQQAFQRVFTELPQ